jgi:hypothetical protein
MTMMRSMLIGSLVGMALMAGSADAQGRGRDGKERDHDDRDRKDGRVSRVRNDSRIPPGHLPAPGECRIWIDGVPPGQQPAPTDCATAERRRPANGRVIYGSESARPGNGKAKGKYKNKDRDRDDDRYERDRRDDRRDDRDRRDDDRYERERAAKGYPADRSPAADGRSDDGRTRSTSRLPEMQVSGSLTSAQSTWLDGLGATRHTYTDANRDGNAERVTWRNARGQTVQVWVDENADGRADAVRMYRGGFLTNTVR